MGGMLYGLAGPTRHITLGRGRASEIGADWGNLSCRRVDDRVIAAQTESVAVTQRCPSDAGTPPASNVAPDAAWIPTERAGRFTKRISHRFPITEVHDAFQLALSPGAAKKAVVTFGD
jgi:hypothetical protein